MTLKLHQRRTLPMQTRRLILTTSSMAVLGLLAHPAIGNAHDARPQSSSITLAAAAATVASATKVDSTKAALRDLWIGHVFWTRNVVVAALANDASARQTAEGQVVANAQSIAAAIEPFYGAPAKAKLFTLLAEHYGAVKAYLDASLAKNEKQKSEAASKLLDNAGEISSFLSGANPHFSKDALGEILQVHASHHIAQIQQLQAKEYAAEAQTWADMTQHMYILSDALAEGLAKQFPKKF